MRRFAFLIVVVTVLLLGLPVAPAAGQDPPQLVFLARADDGADALAAGPVAGKLHAPLLLTARESLSAPAASALEEVAPDEVILVGGTAALDPAIEDALDAMGLAHRRIGGATRIETAAQLALFGHAQDGVTGPPGPSGAAAYASFSVDADTTSGSSDNLVGVEVIETGTYHVVFEGNLISCAVGTSSEGIPAALGTVSAVFASAPGQTTVELTFFDRAGEPAQPVGFSVWAICDR